MTKGLKRLRGNVGVAALAGIVALGAGPAFAAEYEVRMPVEKTARIAPLGDAPGAADAKPAAKPDAKPDAAKAAPKTALGRAAEAAAAAPAKVNSPAPAAGSPEQVAPPSAAPKAAKAAKPAAAPAKKNAKAAHGASPQALSADPDASGDASVTHVPSGPPIPVPGSPAQNPAAPAPAPAAPRAPKPAPVVVVDPKARIMPPAQTAKPAPIPLPADGQWVGDVDVEFQADSIILRAATNGAVERVTWFNVANPAEPRKLAMDLRGNWRKKGGSVLRFDTGPVKNIVVGEHPDRLRLAVEFRDGAVGQSLEPKLESGPKGVAMTIPLAVRLAP